jgi:hypothetical protein
MMDRGDNFPFHFQGQEKKGRKAQTAPKGQRVEESWVAGGGL